MSRRIFDIVGLGELPVGSVLRHRGTNDLIEVVDREFYPQEKALRISGFFHTINMMESCDFPMELLYRPDIDIATKRIDAMRLSEAMSDQGGPWEIRISLENFKNEWDVHYRFGKKEIQRDSVQLGWTIDKMILDLAKNLEENYGKDQTSTSS